MTGRDVAHGPTWRHVGHLLAFALMLLSQPGLVPGKRILRPHQRGEPRPARPCRPVARKLRWRHVRLDAAVLRTPDLPRWPDFRRRRLPPDPPSAGTSRDGRGQRTDLRNLQDLHDHPGQIPADSAGLDRSDHGRLLLLRPATPCTPCRADPGVLPGRYRRLLRASPGSAYASIHWRTAARHLPRWRRSPIPSMPFRSSRASRSACC